MPGAGTRTFDALPVRWSVGVVKVTHSTIESISTMFVLKGSRWNSYVSLGGYFAFALLVHAKLLRFFSILPHLLSLGNSPMISVYRQLCSTTLMRRT